MSALVATDPDAQVQRQGLAVGVWLWPLAGATAVSAAIELGVLRVFTRTVIHIPGAGDASPVLSAIAESGRLAYYVTCVLLIGLLVLLVLHSVLARARMPLAAGAIAAFGITAGGARAGVVGDGTLAVGVLAAVVALGAIAATSRPPLARLPIVAFSAAFATVALDALVAGGIVTVGRGGSLRTAGEALAVIAAVASPLVLGARPSRRGIVLGVGVGILTVALLTVNSSTTTTLMLWNLGFAGTFPWVVYGAAAGALTCTFDELLRSGERRGAIVIVMLAAGGIGLHSTYQSGLVIAGLAMLGLREQASVVEDQELETGGASSMTSPRRTRISAIASSASEATSKG